MMSNAEPRVPGTTLGPQPIAMNPAASRALVRLAAPSLPARPAGPPRRAAPARVLPPGAERSSGGRLGGGGTLGAGGGAVVGATRTSSVSEGQVCVGAVGR